MAEAYEGLTLTAAQIGRLGETVDGADSSLQVTVEPTNLDGVIAVTVPDSQGGTVLIDASGRVAAFD